MTRITQTSSDRGLCSRIAVSRRSHTRATRLRQATGRITCSSNDGTQKLVRHRSHSRRPARPPDQRLRLHPRQHLGRRQPRPLGRPRLPRRLRLRPWWLRGPPPAQTINCSSNDGRRNWCAIGSRRDAQLVRQISGSPCVRGSTWGIDNRGLWVDRGCRADFAFGGGGYRSATRTTASADHHLLLQRRPQKLV